MSLPADELIRRCAPLRLLILDVDGVLTDGVIAIDDRGVETKHFHVRDGSGLVLWRKSGGKAAILSGRKAACVDRRAAELRISPVIQGVPDKLPPFLAMLETLGIEPEQAAFVGDDLADLSVLSRVGLAACPADAAPEVLDVAHVIASKPGGRGAVREIIETILKARGEWDGLMDEFTQSREGLAPSKSSQAGDLTVEAAGLR